PGQRRARGPRHRVAGSPHRLRLRSAPPRRPGGHDPGADRPASRCVLLGHEDCLAARPCSGGPSASGAGEAGLRDGGHVAHLEAHRGPAARHGPVQCLAHDALHIRAGRWDDELLRVLRIPRSLLPDLRASSEVCGDGAAEEALAGAPVAGIAGDQQAALFGQMCIVPGLTKNTYGTGCFTLQHTGERPVISRQRLLTTVAWRIAGRTDYALEGSVFSGGAVVQWLRDGLGLIRSAGEIEALAASVPDSAGIFLVPAFEGLGAPHWDSYARGALVGLTRAATSAHVARAALESIALQVADLLDAMGADAGAPVRELRVDGGAAVNN